MKRKNIYAGITAAGILLGMACPWTAAAADQDTPVLTIWVDALSQYPVRMACYNYYYGKQNEALMGNYDPYPELSWEIVDKSYLSPTQWAAELEEAVKAGEGPDLIYVDESSAVDLQRAMEEGWFLELSEVEQDRILHFDYTDGVLEAGQYEGKQYLLPVFIEYPFALGLSSQLEAAGIHPEENSEDLADFLQALLDASDKSGKKIFEESSAVDWIQDYCFPEDTEVADTQALNDLLEEVRLRSGDESRFFSPYEALESGEYLLSGCSLTNKDRTAQNLALLDTDDAVFLNIPSWNGEICPVITHTAAVNANTAFPQEAMEFLHAFQRALVGTASIIEDYPAILMDDYYKTQLTAASFLTESGYLEEYASLAEGFYSDAGCYQSFLSRIQEAQGSARFKSSKDVDSIQEPSAPKDVITVAFQDRSMGTEDAVYRWLQDTAEKMETEDLHIQLIPYCFPLVVVQTDQFEQAHVGPDILLETVFGMEGYNMSKWYLDLSQLAQGQDLPLTEISGEEKGLAYGISEAKETSYVFAISESSPHKEEAFDFCVKALESSLYQETMDILGLIPTVIN